MCVEGTQWRMYKALVGMVMMAINMRKATKVGDCKYTVGVYLVSCSTSATLSQFFKIQFPKVPSSFQPPF